MANRSSDRESFPLRVRPSSQPRRANRSSDEGPKLPKELVDEVLKRLPVGSLLRFRCVCRSWLKTIDDPRFVALHLSHSALDASNWYLVCLDWCGRLCSLFPSESLALPSRSQIEIPFVTPPERYGVVGSWVGLICVTEYSRNGYGQTMYLWNLFTRKHKAVRRSGPGRQFLSEETPHEALGFGFDARSNDYKIVRVLYFPDDDIDGTKPRVEIYLLRTDSWSSSEREVPAFCGSRPAVFLNGNLHWLAIKSDDLLAGSGYGLIVSFDIAGEVFDEMALPEEIFHVDDDALAVSAAVLNDLLAVFINLMHPRHPEPHSVCSVWVMMEYGAPESWTKLHTFRTSGLVVAFNGCKRNGKLVMEIEGGERVSWNPITSQLTNLPLLTECDLVTVVESLVSL